MIKQISVKVRKLRVIFLVTGLGSCIVLTQLLIVHGTDGVHYIPIVGLILSIVYYKLFNSSKTITYNSEFVFIRYKNYKEEQIPLENIIKLKKSCIWVGYRYLWVIKYTNTSNEESKVFFLPKSFDKSFIEFKKLIAAKSQTEF